jgi:hypothetical protein
MDIYCRNKNTPECIELRNNIKDCRAAGGETMFECVKESEQRYARRTDTFKELVYPWKNFDWDYTRFIDNNYNARATGATQAGTTSALFANTGAMMKLTKGFIIDPNPDSSSSAAQTDLILCDRVPPNNRKSCEVINRIRQSYLNQPKPNNSSFFNKNLNGKQSSSFFYKWGTCRTKDNQTSCKNNKYQWLDGKCYKPRYHLLKNEPGMDFTKLSDNTFTRLANQLGGAVQGNVPSAINNLLSFNPIQLAKVYQRKPQGDYEPEPCPIEDNAEHFGCENTADSLFKTVFFILTMISLIFLFIYIYKKLYS